MIPKKIHYCWFGKKEKPALAVKCINSWKKYCSDYEIIEWNEDTFDINLNDYTRMCYQLKKYAHLSDYVRLVVVEQYGGLYFDTDVEVVKSFDALLPYGAFLGFENHHYVNTGEGFGAEKRHPIVRKLLEEYEFLLDGKHGYVGCPILNTKALEKLGLMKNGQLQYVSDAVVLPVDYLNPLNSVTGKLTKTENTYSIHWYSASWLPWYIRLKSNLLKPFRRLKKRIMGE